MSNGISGQMAKSAVAMITMLLCASIGCGGASSDDGLAAEQAADGASSSSSQSALVAVTTAGASGSAAADVTTSAASSTVASMTPSGCATQAQAGLTVTYTFTNCTGPYGLVSVNGTLEVTYGVAAGGVITAHYSSTNLKVGNTTLALTGDATEQSSGATGSLVMMTESTATGPHGHSVALSGSSNVAWNTSTECMTLTGSWSTKVDTLTWTTTATDFQECKAACPAAGGTIDYTGPVSTVMLSLDGSSNATYTLGDGKSGTLALGCGS